MKTLQRLTNIIKGHPLSTLSFIVILLGVTIYLCFRNFQLSSQLSRYQPKPNSSITVQTISRNSNGKEKVQNTLIESTDAKFQLAPAYSGQLMPNKILYWESKIPAAETLTASVILDNSDSTSSSANHAITQLSGQYPSYLSGMILPNIGSSNWTFSQDSLVQLLLDRKILQLSFYNHGVNKYLSKTYNLDFDQYQYNWTPSIGLTYQKKMMLEVVPYLQMDYEVFNKVISVGTGISFKTRKLDYNIGFSLARYPMVDQMIRPGLEIYTTYKFKKWRK